MRITVFLLLFSVIQVMGGSSYSQNTRLSLNLKNVAIEKVLDEIENQSEFYFLFNQKLVNVDRKVDIDVRNKKIKDILSGLFAGEDINCLVMDRQILLSPKYITDRVNVTRDRQPQEIVVTGKVTDADGNPLPGVNIIIKGTITGAITDSDGNYSIEVDDPEAVLVFTFIGMLTQEIKVGDQTEINITLAQDIIGLEEVVAIGYGTMRKSDLTGAIGKVANERLVSRVVARVDEALQGKIAGVLIQQNSGVPGAAPMIRIRGTNSITEGNQPLWVIDGMPVEDAAVIANINMNDVESIEVLKDAASSAIYGSRGSNGVVLVTTKKGETGAPKISYNMYYGMQKREKSIELMTGPEYTEYLDERRTWQLENDPIFDVNTPNDDRPVNLRIDPDWKTGNNVHTYDWQDYVFRTSYTQNHNLSVSGATDRTNYYLSMEYLDQPGIMQSTNFNRYSFRINLETQISKRIKVGMNLAPSFSTQVDNNSEGKDWTLSVFAYTPVSINMRDEIYYDDLNKRWAHDYASYYGLRVNPYLHRVFQPFQEYNRNQLLSKAFIDIDIVSGISFKSTLHYMINNLQSSDYRDKYIGGVWGAGVRSAYLGTGHNTNLTWENTLNYAKDIGKHSINGLLGYSIQQDYYEYFGVTGGGYENDLNLTLNAASDIINWNHNIQEWSMISMFARARYGYDSRYLLSASLRRDGSSRFGSENKWGFFPAISAAWRISEESFMDSQNIFSILKLRGSFGITGNNRIGNYRPYANLNSRNAALGVDYSTVIGLVPGSFENKELTWEKNQTINLGLDMGVLENRLTMTLDVYSSIIKDLLLDVPVPHTTGFYSAIQNIGEVSNKGIEVELSGHILARSDFSWIADFVFGYNKNEVQKMGPDGAPIKNGPFWARDAAYTGIGHPIGSFWLYETDGIFMTQEEVDESALYANEGVGDVKFVDQNGDGVVDENDRKILGQPTPIYNFGLTNTFIYKGFDLMLFINGAGGHKSFWGLERYMGRPQTNVALKEFVHRWKSPEEPGNGIIPRVTSDAKTNGADEEQDRWLYDSDWWRIKTLSLGYTFPASLLQKAKISYLRLYVSADNLFLKTDYPGWNPEGGQKYAPGIGTSQVETSASSDLGFDFGTIPLAKRFIVGLNITF